MNFVTGWVSEADIGIYRYPFWRLEVGTEECGVIWIEKWVGYCSVWFFYQVFELMADLAGLQEAAGSRFSSLELIGRGSFGDVYKA